MVRIIRAGAVAVVVALAALTMPAEAASRPAQPVTLESFAGVWDGSAQTPNGDVPLHSDFRVADGKLSGTIESLMGPISVTAAALTGDRLVLTIDFQGTPGTLACSLKGGRIEGVWEVGGNSGTFSLGRGGAAAPAAARDTITGSWAGEVQIAGQVMPFTLALREDRGALAGEIGSAEGSVPLGAVAWKNGTLELAFTYVGGQPVSMAAKLESGKLVGTIDFNKGEAAGTWTAARKQ
jgi:hypothetical protein